MKPLFRQVIGESVKKENIVFIVNNEEYSVFLESTKHKGFQYRVSRTNFEKYYETFKRFPKTKKSPVKK